MIGGPSTSRRTPALIFTAGLPSCESLDHARHLPLSGTAERITVCPLAKQSATTDPAQPVSIPHNTVWSVFTPPPFAQLFASSPLVFASGGLKIQPAKPGTSLHISERLCYPEPPMPTSADLAVSLR